MADKEKYIRFSQRIGAKPIKDVIQFESIDDELRNALWNLLWLNFFLRASKGPRDLESCKYKTFFWVIWGGFLNRPLDEMSDRVADIVSKIRKWFFESKWFELYDFLEFLANSDSPTNVDNYIRWCNTALEKHSSGWRFIGKKLAQITNETEIGEIEKALEETKHTDFTGAHTHIRAALELMSDRQNPDYRNSVKESICGVESVVQVISGKPKATLGEGLKKIEEKIGMHPALKEGFLKLYGYTSDADGIRHALSDTSQCDFEEAQYMVVSCSAFINYLILKGKKAQVL